MDFIYYSSASINGFDTYGHFLRAAAQLTNCLEYETIPFPGCEAFFREGSGANTRSAAAPAGSAATAGGVSSAGGSTRTTPAPDGPLPPVDEIIPELEGPLDGDAEQAEPAQPAEPGAGGDSGEELERRLRGVGSPPRHARRGFPLGRSRRRGRVRSPDHGGRLAPAPVPARGRVVSGGRAGSLAASPTLVGAVTVLVVVVAVFLSYQANQGLPFVPTYQASPPRCRTPTPWCRATRCA